MEKSWTYKAREEISHHIGRKSKVDISRISYDKIEVKKDLRIKFMNHGFLHNPSREYRIEFRFKDIDEANDTLRELATYDISGKISINDARKVVIIYVVDKNTILDALRLLGAVKTLKQYKKVSDDKRHIGDTNRLVNFETDNIKKSANASLRQLEDIKKLLKKKNINSLDRDLRIVIKGRTKYKTLSLKELADKISVSKNALNHRFMKIRKMVEG